MKCGWLFFLFLTSLTARAETVKLEGTLFERGTRNPMPGVNVYVLPAKLKATTDDGGRFSIEGVPTGESTVVINAAGYKKLEKKENFTPSGTMTRRYFLERMTYNGLETTVVGKVAKRDDSTKTLRKEEFLTVPGANGDPVKAVQNLPGVARVNGFSSQIVIQGSAPQDTNYMIDDQQVPLVFHFGGFSSVVTPEAVDGVDYLSAGYGPEYGDAMGGYIGLKTRDPATDRTKGFAFVDTSKAGGLVEGPVGEKGSYLVTGRVSYIGQVLGLFARNNSSFDLTVAPSFSDLTGVYKTKISAIDSFKVVSIFSHDELGFLLKEPSRGDPSVRGNFNNQTTFYRIIPQWTRRWDPDHAFKFSLGVGQDLFHVDVGTNYFDLNSTQVNQRAEWESTPGRGWKSFVGVSSEYSHATASFKLPAAGTRSDVPSPISTSQQLDASIVQDEVVIGPFWRNVLHQEDSNWTWMPGVRVDYANITKEVLPQPRMAARYRIDESLFTKSSVGLYNQLPEPQETSQVYGNPDVKSPYAIHYVLGAEKDFKEGREDGWTLNSSLFYKDFHKLVIGSSKYVERDGALVPERYNNEGSGRAYGAEILAKYDGRPLSGWISYTLSQAFRTEPGTSEHPFQYDQTHNVNVVGQFEQKNNWKYSARVRYVTGNPNTPVTGGVFDADNDVYIPTRGTAYSSRLSPFFQVDLRMDKKWVYDTWILSWYLDIQNLTNQKNSEAVRYSYDYSQTTNVTGLPLFPTLGLKGEF